MSLTAEQDAELANDTPAEGDVPDVPDAPASGEQPTAPETETPAGETAGEGTATETEGGDKPAEKKPEEPAPRAWKQVEAAKKAQVQVARAREQLHQEVERVRGFQGQLEARASELDAREARVQPLLKALENRDLAALIELGFDYEDLTRRHLEGQTPEGLAKRALEENKRLRDELADKERKQHEATQAQRQVAETRKIAATLVEIVDGNADEFPELYAWPPERIAEEGLAIRAAVVRKHRTQPTYGQVLAELQRRAKAEADVKTQRTTALQQRRSANPSDAGSAGKVETKGASGSPGTPALNARTANERPSPPRQKTEAEIDEECLAELRGLRR